VDRANLRLLAPVFERLFGRLAPATLDALVDRLRTVHLRRGSTLYRQGDVAEGLHVVLTGRLAVRVEDEAGAQRTVATLGPGDTVGEIALLTGGTRGATVIAVRDATLGALARGDFESVVANDAEARAAAARFVIDRLAASQRRAARPAASERQTVAVLPLDPDVPVAEFTHRLALALLRHGRTTRVDEVAIRSRFPEAFTEGISEGDEVAVGRHLDALEARSRFLLLEGSWGAEEWAARALGYADRVLLVGRGAVPQHAPWFERALAASHLEGARPAVELALLHPHALRLPTTTREWLGRIQVDRHYHVPWRGNSGFHRLARLLAGRAVTLVLGGGGARGFAHVGVVRALRELGIPIDAVGGTSFGGVVAAMVAMGLADEWIHEEFKVGFADNRPLNDYTLPVVSLVRGRKLVAALRRHFGEARIEDMWLPYFTVSSSLSHNRMRVHERGEVWRALRATVSLPAIFPPFVDEGELLVDGGILNNLPVEVMRGRIRGAVVAVDLSVDSEFRIAHEEVPSVWAVLGSRLVGSARRLDVPTLHEVIVKSTTLASRREVEAARREADLYLNPPVGEFELLDWGRFAEIVEAGYRHALAEAGAWARANPDVVHRDELFDSRERGAAARTVEAAL